MSHRDFFPEPVALESRDLESGLEYVLPRAASVQDIVIPAHLLATVNDREDWTPAPERQRDPSPHRVDDRRDFDVQRFASEQQDAVEQSEVVDLAILPRKADADGSPRSGSVAVDAFPRRRAHTLQNDFTGPDYYGRKTSLPLVLRGFPRTVEEPDDREPERPHLLPRHSSGQAAKSGGALLTVPLEDIPEGTVLFKKLSSYNLQATAKSQAKLGDDDRDDEDVVDPFTPPTFFVADDDTRATAEENASNVSALPTISPFSTPLDRAGRRPTLQTISETVSNVVHSATAVVTNTVRKSSMADIYEKAKARGIHLQRKKWVQVTFEIGIYILLLCFIYFVLVGVPLWKGAVWWMYWIVDNKFVVAGTWSITIGLAVFYAYTPLLIFFENEPPMPPNIENIDPKKTPGVHNTALLIPCYKSARIIGPTLDAALKIFPADHIFVIANGNSPTPLDDTEAVCRPYGVNHIWSPVGSKIVAQFVGCYAAKHFENVLLIDDDCALPANFPIVSDRMKGKVKCIGYTIKSVGPESSKGTLCQQAQDLEYKISGLQRALAGKIGSATFPHGAISLWNTAFLIKTFHTHPGFSVSEDWFFGHVARKLGCRIKMCTAVFVETETPTDVLFSSGGARGGFGEMTIFKQRFYRWNFFFVNGMYYNMAYILGSWKLGWWELGAKLFVFQEVYETLLYLLAPFVLPISFIVRPSFCGYLMAITFALYYVNVAIFNEIHLRRRNERVGSFMLYVYYAPYKIVLTAINIFSCYYSLYKYARYFAKRHPKVIEHEKAVEVVLRLEETPPTPTTAQSVEPTGRRLTITAVGTRIGSSAAAAPLGLERTRTMDFAEESAAR